MKQRPKRLLVHPLLRQCVDDEPLEPDPPIACESWLPSFSPLPAMLFQLPREPGKAGENHGEKHHLHPWSDVAEDLPRRVIHGASLERRSTLLQRLDELRHDLMQVTDKTIGRHLKNRCVGVFVYRHDDA